MFLQTLETVADNNYIDITFKGVVSSRTPLAMNTASSVYFLNIFYDGSLFHRWILNQGIVSQ
ncbi:MAG: hypothetical protein QXZ41_08205 [Ignisphaera sp.]|uniref:Uncharacterized protein n=1 Tax=Ignisphaera aggregans TaxID=334771 RepID=A0A7C4JKP6_9CREN